MLSFRDNVSGHCGTLAQATLPTPVASVIAAHDGESDVGCVGTSPLLDSAYARGGAVGVSWYQDSPDVSLELIETLAIEREAAVIDVGGGASNLVDHLIARGFSDLPVLDVSPGRPRRGTRSSGS